MSILTPESIIAAAPGPIVGYAKAAELTGGLIGKKTLYNLCSLGEGPARIRIGRKVGFKVEDFATWICERVEDLPKS